jgi:TPP-dependent pyruvate/acetoin dehydrogenase alpha subunit
MSGKVRRTGATTAHSTGGSLISDEKLQQLYATMLQCRMLTEYSQRLPQRTSSARLYKGSMGQEAIACGCAIDLRPEDTIVVAPHDSIARLVKGVAIGELVKELHERPARNDLALKLSMAMDVAVRNKKKKTGNVVLVFADRTTARLDRWKQTMEMAGKTKLPMIFVAENNPWPGPARVQVNHAAAYPFPVFTVDANDVVAVYRVAYESLQRVRVDPCPVLIQALPYRLPHERDPLLHMERYLKAKKLFSARWKNQVAKQFSRQLGSYHRASRPPAND